MSIRAALRPNPWLYTKFSAPFSSEKRKKTPPLQTICRKIDFKNSATFGRQKDSFLMPSVLSRIFMIESPKGERVLYFNTLETEGSLMKFNNGAFCPSSSGRRSHSMEKKRKQRPRDSGGSRECILSGDRSVCLTNKNAGKLEDNKIINKLLR